MNLKMKSLCSVASWSVRSRHRQTSLRVPEHQLYLFARHAAKPLQKIIDSRAVFEVLEQCLDRHPRPFEQPFATDFSRHAFNGRTLTPIKHNTSEAGLACKAAGQSLPAQLEGRRSSFGSVRAARPYWLSELQRGSGAQAA